jgi:chromosome segregation ATPase
MKKSIVTVALIGMALIGSGPIGFAHDPSEESPNRNWHQRDHSDLRSEIDHLNRMITHVRRELRKYGANRHIRREFSRIVGQANHLNDELRGGYARRRHIHAEVERLHAELHHIEEELHVRTEEYYRW